MSYSSIIHTSCPLATGLNNRLPSLLCTQVSACGRKREIVPYYKERVMAKKSKTKSKGNVARRVRPSSEKPWIRQLEASSTTIKVAKEPKVSLMAAVRLAIKENEILVAKLAQEAQVGVLDPELAKAVTRIKELKQQLQAAN